MVKVLRVSYLRVIFNLALCIIFMSFASCAYQVEPRIKEKRILYFHDIESILVVPFVDYSGTPNLSQTVTETFTSELARFNETGVVHAEAVFDYLNERRVAITKKNLEHVGLEIGAAFGVEAIVLGIITEKERYFPPKLGLSFEIITLADQKTIFADSETYDASYNYVREALDKYAGAKKTTDSVYGKELIMRKYDLFVEFVCFEIVRKNF